MDWLDDIEQKLKEASPEGVFLSHDQIVAQIEFENSSPEMVAKLIAALRMVEAELQRYAKFESWSKEKNTDGYSNWMWASNMQIGNDPGVYARNTLAKLQSGEFGEADAR